MMKLFRCVRSYGVEPVAGVAMANVSKMNRTTGLLSTFYQITTSVFALAIIVLAIGAVKGKLEK